MNKFFETIKIDNQKAHHLAYHQKRFETTYIAHFKKNPKIRLEKILNTHHKDLTRAKVIYDESEIVVEYYPYIPKSIQTIKIVNCESIEYNYKFFDRSCFENLCTDCNADEIAIFKNGLLTDSSIANIAIYENDKWISPKKPLLFGTTLQRYVHTKVVTLEDIDLQRFCQCEKIAFLNAMIDFTIYSNMELKIF